MNISFALVIRVTERFLILHQQFLYALCYLTSLLLSSYSTQSKNRQSENLCDYMGLHDSCSRKLGWFVHIGLKHIQPNKADFSLMEHPFTSFVSRDYMIVVVPTCKRVVY